MSSFYKLFDLAGSFPTEKSRYSAFYKLYKFNYVVLPLLAILQFIMFIISEIVILPNGKYTFLTVLKFIIPPERLSFILSQSTFIGDNVVFYILNFMINILTIIAITVYIYVNIYLFIKSGIFKYMLKILIFLCITLFLSLIPGIAPLMAVIALFTLKKRRERLEKYKECVKYIGSPLVIFGYMTMGMIIILYIISRLVASNSDGGAILAIPILMGSLIIYVTTTIVLWICMLYTFYKYMKKEEAAGVPFLTMYKKSVVVPITYFLLLFSIVNLIGGHFFSANSLITDMEDVINDGSVDNIANNDLDSAYTEQYDNINNADNFINKEFVSNNIDESSLNNSANSSAFNEIDSNVALPEINNSLDFNGIVLNTPMHVNAFQDNPYMLFAMNHNPVSTDMGIEPFDICSNDGIAQIHVKADGQMLDSEFSPLGRLVHGADGGITMFDNNNIELVSVDKFGFAQSGDFIIGKIENNGGMTTFRDFQNTEIGYTANGTTWVDGKIVAQIKQA